MDNLPIAIFVIFIIAWFYSLISVFTSEFKEEKAKVFWRIGLIFVPFLVFFYLYMKKDLINKY